MKRGEISLRKWVSNDPDVLANISEELKAVDSKHTIKDDQSVKILGRIIGKLEEGRSVTSVAAEFGIAHSIVSRLWRQFQTTGTAIRGFSSGRPRGTTPADDWYIGLQAADSGRNR
ncbi:hypothetical protein TNCV_1179221 [Trichonephila clavipes]|nr:hypothetical protein TNCV_1179221 [Trichonephila clavipes]